VCLTIVAIPLLISTSKRGHLQKITAIRARLLGPVHCILYRPNALLGHPNIAQIVKVERTTLLHTLLALQVRGDTFTWVVDA